METQTPEPTGVGGERTKIYVTFFKELPWYQHPPLGCGWHQLQNPLLVLEVSNNLL
jgi:hypothetical protein